MTANRKDGKKGPTYQLFASALLLCIFILLFVSRFAGLGGMEPTADTQPLVVFRTLVHYDLFHRVVTPPRLYLEEYEFVPAGWN